MGSRRHITREVTPRRHALLCRSWENLAWGSSVQGLALAVLFFPLFPFLFSFLFLFLVCFSALCLGLEHQVLAPGELGWVLPGAAAW